MASLTRQFHAHPRTILVVEDNAAEAELTLRALAARGLDEGVVIARDGAEALDFMFCRGKFAHRSINEQPHLVLLDLNLPLINGVDVLRHIRAESLTRFVPVVMLSCCHPRPVYSRLRVLPRFSFYRRHNVLRTAHEDDLRSRRIGVDDVKDAIEPGSGLVRRGEIHGVCPLM